MSTQPERSNPNLGAHLPPELLVEVFLFTQKIWSPRGTSQPPFRYRSGWMTVLHVCAIWRRAQVALATPALWQDVNALDVHPNLAPEYLARSADLGLRLSFRFSTSTNSRMSLARTIWLNAAVIRRLESLDIEFFWPDKRFNKILAVEAPGIRQLVLRDISSVPLNMLGTAFPRLLRLSINSCRIPPTSPLFAFNLTHLKVVSSEVSLEMKTNVGELLSVLAVLPALEHLRLQWGLLGCASEDQPLPRACLPALEYWFLDLYEDLAPTDEYTDLLEYTCIPPTARLVVNTLLHNQWDDFQYRPIFTLVFSDDLTSASSVELDLTSEKQWYVYQWDPVTKLRTGGRRINVLLDEECDGAVAIEDVIRSTHPQSLVVGGAFWQYFPNGEPTFHPTTNVNPTFWDKLSSAQDVRCLTVCYPDHKYLWAMLRSKPTLFPLLETIVLTDTTWSWSDTNGQEPKPEFDEQTLNVHKCVVNKAEISHMIPHLLYTVLVLRHVGVSLRDIKIQGELAQWSGWDNVHALLSNLDIASTAPGSGSAVNREACSLSFPTSFSL